MQSFDYTFDLPSNSFTLFIDLEDLDIHRVSQPRLDLASQMNSVFREHWASFRSLVLPALISNSFLIPLINFVSARVTLLIDRVLGEGHTSKWGELVEGVVGKLEHLKTRRVWRRMRRARRIEFVTVSEAQPKEQQLLSNLQNSQDPRIIKKEGELMSSTITKTLRFQQSVDFPVTKDNVRLVQGHRPCIRIRGVRSEKQFLYIELEVDIDNTLAQTVSAEMEVSSGKLFYMFNIRLGTKDFRLLKVYNQAQMRQLGECLLYVIHVMAMLYFTFKLARSAWALYREVHLMLYYLKSRSGRQKILNRIDKAKKTVIRLFDGLGKKVMRILGSMSDLKHILQMFIRVDRTFKAKTKRRTGMISMIDNRMIKERTRQSLIKDENELLRRNPAHKHVISQPAVLKQMYVKKNLELLTEEVKSKGGIEHDLKEKLRLLKSMSQGNKFQRKDTNDLKESQVTQARLSRPPRKKTLQVSKRLSDLSEVTVSAIITRFASKVKPRREPKDGPMRKARKRAMRLRRLNFREKSLLAQVGGLHEQAIKQVLFRGNPFYNSTKVKQHEQSMIESLGESQSESVQSVNSLRQGLLLRENSVYWSMLHKMGVHQDQPQFKMPQFKPGREIFWPTFVFSTKRRSSFRKYLKRFELKNSRVHYSDPVSPDESSDQASSKAPSITKGPLSQVTSLESNGDKPVERCAKEKLYKSISKMNESHSFSIEKNLVEMMDQKRIKAKFSMEEISEPLAQRERIQARIPKVKSQNLGVGRREISNEEYFDLIDQEKGSKKSRLNDIFKNFQTKKIEEKEEIMKFPFAISEEDDSQDETTGELKAAQPAILKTESYHVISSTSSFRSGKGSRFIKKKGPSRPTMGQAKKVTLAGRDEQSSVYSGKLSRVSGDNGNKWHKKSRKGSRNSEVLISGIRGESFISRQSKKSKRSKNNRRKNKKRVKLSQVEADDSRQERAFKGLDDTILREKRDASNSPMTKKQKEAEVDRVIRSLQPQLIVPELEQRDSEAEPHRKAFLKESKDLFAEEDSLEVFLPNATSSPERPTKAKKKKKKKEKMKEKMREKQRRAAHKQAPIGMMFPPQFIPDPRMYPLHEQQMMLPVRYGLLPGYSGMPMLRPVNINPKSFGMKAKPNTSAMDVNKGVFWPYMNPQMSGFIPKGNMQPPGRFQFKYPMEMMMNSQSQPKSQRQKKAKKRETEKIIKFDSSNDEQSEKSNLQTSGSNMDMGGWRYGDQQIWKHFKAEKYDKPESESDEEESGFNPFEKQPQSGAFGRGFMDKDISSRENSDEGHGHYLDKKESLMMANPNLNFMDSDEDAQSETLKTQQNNPKHSYLEKTDFDECFSPRRIQNNQSNRCFLEDGFFQDTQKESKKEKSSGKKHKLKESKILKYSQMKKLDEDDSDSEILF